MLGLVHVKVEDFLLDHLWVFPIERITLVKEEVDAASESPNVDLLAEAILFKDELRG